MTIEPKTLQGFNDILPPQSIIKSKFIDILKSNFQSYGFVPLETPHLEYTEVLLGNAQGDVKKELFRFQDNGERDVCLRFDLTVPLARVLAQYSKQLVLPFKRYAIGNCFRGERPQKGRYREFTQCDFDFVGVTSLYADAEIISIIETSLKLLGFSEFTIKYNNRKLMNALAEELGIQDVAEFLRIIDKLHKIGKDKISELLKNTLNLSEENVLKVFEFLELKDISVLKEKSESYRIAIDELDEIGLILNKLGVKNAKLDLTICRGLGYYTGIVYETNLTNYPDIGSVASGGRYDQLASNFTKENLPGVGASIGLDRLMSIVSLDEVKMNKSILFCNMGISYMDQVFDLANKFRNSNLTVEVYPENTKLKKQFQYADRKKFNYVLVYGENEALDRSISIKNLSTGTSEIIKIDNLELSYF